MSSLPTNDQVPAWKRVFGPLRKFLDDPSITEIMVNGHEKIFVEQGGRIKRAGLSFPSNDYVGKLINAIAQSCGKKINIQTPLVDARLPDGSRVHMSIPPASVDWPTITIRKHALGASTCRQLIEYGTMDEKMAYFLSCCVQARLNIIVSGGTGSGKTTLLNILSSFIEPHERIVTIEDTVELKLKNENLIRLEARDLEQSENPMSISELLRHSLRMRPDRIIVGECRGGEAMDMLTAMNTGHEGSMTSVHANSARDAIRRLESMVAASSTELPFNVIRSNISSAVHVIVQVNRFADGKRRITEIIEVGGMESDTILTQDIFSWDEKTGFQSMGFVPQFIKIFRKKQIKFPPDFFSDKYQVKQN